MIAILCRIFVTMVALVSFPASTNEIMTFTTGPTLICA
jgi:hypothetical protein